MIFVLYEGLDITEFAERKQSRIVLDSHLFTANADSKYRCWEIAYCNVAESLSKQGYTVFVDASPKVEKILNRSEEVCYVVYPSIHIFNRYRELMLERFKRTADIEDFETFQKFENLPEMIEKTERIWPSQKKIPLEFVSFDLYSILEKKEGSCDEFV